MDAVKDASALTTVEAVIIAWISLNLAVQIRNGENVGNEPAFSTDKHKTAVESGKIIHVSSLKFFYSSHTSFMSRLILYNR